MTRIMPQVHDIDLLNLYDIEGKNTTQKENPN